MNNIIYLPFCCLFKYLCGIPHQWKTNYAHLVPIKPAQSWNNISQINTDPHVYLLSIHVLVWNTTWMKDKVCSFSFNDSQHNHETIEAK